MFTYRPGEGLISAARKAIYERAKKAAARRVTEAKPNLLKATAGSRPNQKLALDHEIVLMSGKIASSEIEQQGVFMNQSDEVDDAFLRTVLPMFREAAKHQTSTPMPTTPSPDGIKIREGLKKLEAVQKARRQKP